MNAKAFPIFDCDSHIVEPPAIWDEYVPREVRAWVKTQFHFHTDTDVLLINGRAVPASRTPAWRASTAWAAHSYWASSARATVMIAISRTVWGSGPSKRT